MTRVDSIASSYERFASTKQFGSLDGLRAISVAAVVWHHTGGGALGGWFGRVGSEGVTLFFAISGFLITSLLTREFERNGRIDLKAFYMRRALRIFPLYYGVILLYVFAVFTFERNSAVGQSFFGNLVFFLTYTSNWFVPLDGRVIFYFAWSLAAEEQFYALWPPLMRMLGRSSRILYFTVTVAIVLSVIDALAEWWDPEAAAPITWVVAKVPLAIIFGVVAALVIRERSGFEKAWSLLAASRWHAPIWLVLAVAATAVPGTPRPLIHAGMAAAVTACVMRPDHWLNLVLDWRSVTYMGSISYGIYLLHMLCKNAYVMAAAKVGISLGSAALFMGTLVISTVVATLSFRYYESYFLGLKHRFSR